jgi:hypothetical protein
MPRAAWLTWLKRLKGLPVGIHTQKTGASMHPESQNLKIRRRLWIKFCVGGFIWLSRKMANWAVTYAALYIFGVREIWVSVVIILAWWILTWLFTLYGQGKTAARQIAQDHS